MFQLFEHQCAGALAEDHAVAAPVERPACSFRSVVAVRQRLIETLTHEAERVDLAFSAADEQEVGLISLEDAEGLAHRQKCGDVVFGNAVVGPLGVVQDRHMAGEHVGQVLEHPERRHRRQSLGPPFIQID